MRPRVPLTLGNSAVHVCRFAALGEAVRELPGGETGRREGGHGNVPAFSLISVPLFPLRVGPLEHLLRGGPTARHRLSVKPAGPRYRW